MILGQKAALGSLACLEVTGMQQKLRNWQEPKISPNQIYPWASEPDSRRHLNSCIVCLVDPLHLNPTEPTVVVVKIEWEIILRDC